MSYGMTAVSHGMTDMSHGHVIRYASVNSAALALAYSIAVSCEPRYYLAYNTLPLTVSWLHDSVGVATIGCMTVCLS